MVPVAVKHLELLALGTRGWHELKAAHIAGFLGDRKILDKNDLTFLNQRPVPIWVDFLNLK
jgi:hypothetical protein